MRKWGASHDWPLNDEQTESTPRPYAFAKHYARRKNDEKRKGKREGEKETMELP